MEKARINISVNFPGRQSNISLKGVVTHIQHDKNIIGENLSIWIEDSELEYDINIPAKTKYDALIKEALKNSNKDPTV